MSKQRLKESLELFVNIKVTITKLRTTNVTN